MQILFQLPKILSVSDLPKNASVGTEFSINGVEYTIDLGPAPDAGVLINGVLHKIDALYIVRPI
ncbi:hypothetical protein NEIG_01608 [Nematocida sp. ERTm5]|nr:hypothetical protein NEIRO02_0569 [Nematocida sp. AWRm79]KAI5183699.1 hypothetical protein NEIRO03_1275 [Nematocida sp. AWRm78]OAG33183.1 hypothetical protein NEIG_01608 [Nematocida sp. ERTm5]